MSTNYYELLGVARDARPEDIKRAYRKLAMKYHPDVATEDGAAEKFKAINEAYERVVDSDVRHLHWFRHELGDRVKDLAVLTTGPAAYRRPDGIAVVPLGLLGL